MDTESFGSLLRRHRGARGFTQEELAERAGLHVQEISKLERGVRLSPRSTTVEFLADALKLGAQERAVFVAAARGVASAVRGQVRATGETSLAELDLAHAESLIASLPADAVPPRGPLPAGSRVPLAPNPLFIGRGEELLQVAAALRGGDTTVALGQVVASTGLGGLGKTQLAVELVHRYGRYFAGGVYWLSFASADEIPLQIAACAEPGFEARPLEERIRRVNDSWQSAVPRLLVFDNCEEEALLDAWRPPSGGCRVLVTSRRSRWSPTLGVTTLPLDLLPRADSIELLRRYLPDLTADDPRLDAIAEEVGDLPLALHLAGSYLRVYRPEVTLDEYLAELRQSDVVQHASLLGAGMDDSPSPTRHVQAVAQTFAICLGRLDRESEVDQIAIALLARMACMAPGEAVPRDLLARTVEASDARLRADGLHRLAAAGLVEEGEGWLRLHRLLAHFLRQEELDPDAQAAVERALISYGDDISSASVSGPALGAVIPHLVRVAGRGSNDELRLARLCGTAGGALTEAGNLSAAHLWLERALNATEKVLGNDHPETGDSLMYLAWLLRVQGEGHAARPLVERALHIRERAFGPDHASNAACVNYLALLLWDEGELAAAGPLFERALAIRERGRGPDDPLTAQSLNNLALLRRDQGDLAAATSLLERALAICETVLGLEHRYTAQCLDNLGSLLKLRDRPGEARVDHERALSIRERVLGPDHPDTAFSLHNLALLHRDQGDPAAARPLFERALAIRERVLGPDHPDTIATRRALDELAEGGG